MFARCYRSDRILRLLPRVPAIFEKWNARVGGRPNCSKSSILDHTSLTYFWCGPTYFLTYLLYPFDSCSRYFAKEVWQDGNTDSICLLPQSCNFAKEVWQDGNTDWTWLLPQSSRVLSGIQVLLASATTSQMLRSRSLRLLNKFQRHLKNRPDVLVAHRILFNAIYFNQWNRTSRATFLSVWYLWVICTQHYRSTTEAATKVQSQILLSLERKQPQLCIRNPVSKFHRR